jgi:KDO2-lipid IV(A) lauroyltransferase
MRAIKNGSSAGLVMDRRVDEGKPVPFFGRDKMSTMLPAKLALKFDIDMVPVQVKRLRGAEFKLIYYPPIKPADPSADENVQALDMITQLHQLFEQWIREDPQDWFCPKRMWPKMESNADDSSSNSSSNKSTEENSYAA